MSRYNIHEEYASIFFKLFERRAIHFNEVSTHCRYILENKIFGNNTCWASMNYIITKNIKLDFIKKNLYLNILTDDENTTVKATAMLKAMQNSSKK